MVLALIVHWIVAVWIMSCVRHWSIDCYCLVDITNKIVPSVSGVDISRDCSHGIVAVWIVSCLKHSSIDRYCLVDIANKIAPSGSGIDSSCYCSRVDRVLFETLITWLHASVLTPIANRIVHVDLALIVLSIWLVLIANKIVSSWKINS